MRTCESCFVLVSCLCSMSNWLGRRNARACLRKGCCINFLSERLSFPLISSFSLVCSDSLIWGWMLFQNRALFTGSVPRVITGDAQEHPPQALRYPRLIAEAEGRMVYISVHKTKLWSVSSFTDQTRLSKNAKKILPELKITGPSLWDFAARDWALFL